jgi:DNA polymerase III epsilon subunit-like protein
MMKRLTIEQTAEFLRTCRDVHILIHRSPDGDCIGAGYSLQAALRQLGIRSRVLCADPIPARFDYLLPEEPEEDFMEYSDNARKVHGVTIAMQEELGGTLEEVCDEIIDFVSRNTFNVSKANMPFFIGQNPWFDEGFLEQIFLYTGKWEQFLKLVRTKKDFWGNAHIVMLDTILLSQLAFNGDPTVENWKLEASALRLGIDLDDAHDADADVTATGEIVRVLTARMRNASADGSGGMMAMEKKTKLRDHFKI